MSNVRCRVPELRELKDQLEDPVQVDYYRRQDLFIGPSESIEYLLKFLESYVKKSKFHPKR